MTHFQGTGVIIMSVTSQQYSSHVAGFHETHKLAHYVYSLYYILPN
jgi:hypothetical protein